MPLPPFHFNLSPGPRVLLNRVPTGKNGDAAPPEGRLAHHGLPSLRPFGSRASFRALPFRPT